MTSKQITRKLVKAGIDTAHCEIQRDEVEVVIPDKHNEGRCDSDACYELASKIAKELNFPSLRSRGHGGWGVFNEPAVDLGDWNDRSFRHHY